ncbi:MAG: Uma2 family endonuclease [Spirosomataceae bacterium]
MISQPIVNWTFSQMQEYLPADVGYELINDELFKMPTPSAIHQEISANLDFLMQSFVRHNQLGKLFTAPLDVLLDSTTVVEPDLFFIENSKRSIIKQHVEGVPDLVVEIISPSSYIRDTITKKELYERFGIKEYWLIDPANQVIEVFVLENGKFQLHNYAVETGIVRSVVLEGFEAEAHDILVHN